MKKKLALLLTLLFTLSILVGCGGDAPAEKKDQPKEEPKQETSDDSWKKVKDQGFFVLGLDDAFPPMGFREEGTNNIVGFDIDLAKEVAQRMGVEVKLQPVVWDTIVEELNGGKIDVIWNGLTITDTRKEQIDFSQPYIANRQIIIVQPESEVKTKADFKDKKVGIQAGSSAMEAVSADKEVFESVAEWVEFGSNDEALLDLASGRLDAVVVDEVVGRYYIAKKPDEYKIIEDNFGAEEYGIGFRKGDDAFRAEVNKALDAMKADGKAAEISQKWFGEDIFIK